MKANQLFILLISLGFTMCKSSMGKIEKDEISVLKDSTSIRKDISEPLILPSTIRSKNDNAEMVLIPWGFFTYGINERRRDSTIKELTSYYFPVFKEEFPEERIFLRSYYIDKYEVTNQQYDIFLRETGYARKPRYWNNPLYNKPKQPVVGILWQDAVAYAKWAGKRLPSEQEWEKAARGPKGNIFPWGNEPAGEKYNGHSSGNLTPVDVGSYPAGASIYGIMDMAGNVYEYTTAIWTDSIRVMRGGSYLNTGAYVMTTFRWGSGEPKGAEYLGFRCVMDTVFAMNHENLLK